MKKKHIFVSEEARPWLSRKHKEVAYQEVLCLTCMYACARQETNKFTIACRWLTMTRWRSRMRGCMKCLVVGDVGRQPRQKVSIFHPFIGWRWPVIASLLKSRQLVARSGWIPLKLTHSLCGLRIECINAVGKSALKGQPSRQPFFWQTSRQL